MTIRHDGVIQRAPRPFTAWAVMVLVWGLVFFVLAVLAAIAVGFWMTAGQGRAVPNITGGLEGFGPVLAALMGASGLGGLIFHQRHVERRDQINRGTAPAGPFDSSPAEGPQGPGNTP